MTEKNLSKRIVIITEERNDAIGIYNGNIISALEQITQVRNIHLENHPFKSKFLNYVVEIFNAILLLGKIRKEDIILFTDPIAFKANTAFFIGNEKYTVVQHFDEEKPAYIKLLPFLAFKNLLKKFTKIIAASEFSRQQLLELGIPGQNICIIHNGIDHSIFHKIDHKIRDIQGEYLISVNNEMPRKNMNAILEAFSSIHKRYPSLKLVKIGRATPNNRKNTLDLMRKHDLEQSVIILENVESNKLASYYSGAKAMVLPSLREGFGLPIVEAMACGCPVITSNISPMKEIATDSQILIDPEDPNKIAQGIDRVLRDEEYAKMLSEEGLKRAKDFDWKITARKIEELIDG